MNSISTRISRAVAGIAVAAACITVSACGEEIEPPAQDISRTQAKPSEKPSQPARTGRGRSDFRDEFGTAGPKREKPDHRHVSGNRMDFRDAGY